MKQRQLGNFQSGIVAQRNERLWRGIIALPRLAVEKLAAVGLSCPC